MEILPGDIVEIKQLNNQYSFGRLKNLQKSNEIMMSNGLEVSRGVQNNPVFPSDIFIVLFDIKNFTLVGYAWFFTKPMCLQHFIIIPEFRRRGLGKEFLIRLDLELQFEYVEKPEPIMVEMLKKYCKKKRITYRIPFGLVGPPDPNSLPLYISLHEYSKIDKLVKEWLLKAEALDKTIYENKNDGPMKILKFQLDIIEFIEKNGYIKNEDIAIVGDKKAILEKIYGDIIIEELVQRHSRTAQTD